MEVAAVGLPVALRGEQAAGGRVAGDRPLDEEEVGLLARLHDAELGVERGGRGDEPVRMGAGATLGRRGRGPGRPALVGAGLVGREPQ